MSESIENKSYLAILISAKKLFSKHGISRVTVDEICAESGICKMTFYRNFSNKFELAKVVLNHIIKSGWKDYDDIMNLEIPFQEKIKQLILLKSDSSSELSEEFIKDIYNKPDSGLMEILISKQEQMIDKIIADFTKAQCSGSIRKEINMSFLIYYINKISEMMFDEKFRKLYPNIHDAAMELTNIFFYGIINNKD